MKTGQSSGQERILPQRADQLEKLEHVLCLSQFGQLETLRLLKGVAETLKMEMKSDAVSHQLSDLGIIQKKRTEGLCRKL